MAELKNLSTEGNVLSHFYSRDTDKNDFHYFLDSSFRCLIYEIF